jgi:hypothetical protein
VPLQPIKIEFNSIAEIHSNGVRVQRPDALDCARSLSDLQAAVSYLTYLVRRFDDAFGKKESGRKLSIVTRRSHCDRDCLLGAFAVLAKTDTYLKRLFNRECVMKFLVGCVGLN